MAEEPQMLVQKLRVQRGWSQEQLAELTWREDMISPTVRMPNQVNHA
jgi:hypothetical protein